MVWYGIMANYGMVDIVWYVVVQWHAMVWLMQCGMVWYNRMLFYDTIVLWHGMVQWHAMVWFI